MNATNRKFQSAKEYRVYSNMADELIKIAILTADDIWGVTPEATERFIKAFEEVVNGYGEIGVAEIDKELAERGIEVNVNGKVR